MRRRACRQVHRPGQYFVFRPRLAIRKHREERMRIILLVALLAAWVLPAAADDYPSRPITLIVPYPPGGGVDTIARVMSAKLTVALGQQIVIENRPGAGAVIGTRAAAKAPADGYTLVMVASGFTLP